MMRLTLSSGLHGAVSFLAVGLVLVGQNGNEKHKTPTPPPKPPARIITTYAGSGVRGHGGDGGPAIDAGMMGPRGLAFDKSGNLYVADSGNNTIRKISPEGIITLFAGNPTGRGYNGDDRPATEARMGGPGSIVFDSQGNLYIADSQYGTGLIRKVRPDGTMTTVAGRYGGVIPYGSPYLFATSGTPNLPLPTGLAVDDHDNVYFADASNDRVYKLDPTGVITKLTGNGKGGYSGDGGPALSAQLYYPEGLAVDAQGNVFIGDSGNRRIRKVSPDGIISTIAGTGVASNTGDGGPATSAGIHTSRSMCFDEAGNLYIADREENVVRMITPAGIISVFAGHYGLIVGGMSLGDKGAATSALVQGPSGLAVDKDGNVFIADSGDDRIRKVSR